MKLFLFSLLVTVVNSQITIDPAILIEIFGKPLTSAPGSENFTTIAPFSSGSTTTVANNDISFIFEKPISTVSTSEATIVPTVSTSRTTTVSSIPTSETTTFSSIPTSDTTFFSSISTSGDTIVPTVSTSGTIVPSILTSGTTIASSISTSETTTASSISASGTTTASSTPSSKTTIDADVLSLIFDKPLTPSPMITTTAKEKVMKKNNTILIPIEEKVHPCYGNCVPFYACATYKVESDDGAGQLMPRFAHHERSCERAEEVCCSVPWHPGKINTPLIPVKTLKCGYRNPEGVGVTSTYADTQLGEFPWVVAVLDEKWTYLGVGVLISSQVVMTAAHIAANYTTGNLRLRIRAGEWNSQSPNDIFPFQERIVKEIFIHKDYNKIDRRSNNIALLRFEHPLKLSEYVNTICMPEQDEVFDSYRNCVANGWGKDTFGLKGRYAVILKKVELNIVPYSRCSILLKNTRLGSRFRLHPSFLCAGGKQGEDTCEGDGGAPLACPIGDNRYKLTGLVAWGVGCGQKNVPGVYTNVPKFREWVDWKMADWGLATASYKI